jgi:hypothetical protein
VKSANTIDKGTCAKTVVDVRFVNTVE